MADTLPNIALPQNTWVNLYAEQGSAIGTVLAVQNIGVVDIYLASQEMEPSQTLDKYCVLQRFTGQWFRNEEGDTGAWVYCLSVGGLLSIREV